MKKSQVKKVILLRQYLDEMSFPSPATGCICRAVDHKGEILDISAHYDRLIAVPATISKVPSKTHLLAV